MAEGEEVENKQVILKHYVRGSPKESDMEIRTGKTKLKLPEGSSGAIVVKNLYLSCDPYMRNRMSKVEGSYVESFTPGSVSTKCTDLDNFLILNVNSVIFFVFFTVAMGTVG